MIHTPASESVHNRALIRKTAFVSPTIESFLLLDIETEFQQQKTLQVLPKLKESRAI